MNHSGLHIEQSVDAFWIKMMIHKHKTSEGEFCDNPKYAEEAVDDFLSCTSLDFLGKGTRPFFNRKDPSDSSNKTFCTVPVKLS
jgi:hypothetical protein